MKENFLQHLAGRQDEEAGPFGSTPPSKTRISLMPSTTG